MTDDEVIGDALLGLEAVRAGNNILAKFNEPLASAIGVALSAAYEGLVALRQAILNDSEESIRAHLAEKAERLIQELAALRFGAEAPPGLMPHD